MLGGADRADWLPQDGRRGVEGRLGSLLRDPGGPPAGERRSPRGTDLRTAACRRRVARGQGICPRLGSGRYAGPMQPPPGQQTIVWADSGADALATVPLFARLSDDHVRAIARLATIQETPKGARSWTWGIPGTASTSRSRGLPWCTSPAGAERRLGVADHFGQLGSVRRPPVAPGHGRGHRGDARGPDRSYVVPLRRWSVSPSVRVGPSRTMACQLCGPASLGPSTDPVSRRADRIPRARSRPTAGSTLRTVDHRAPAAPAVSARGPGQGALHRGAPRRS